jgi:hypothetical protein
MKMTNIQQNEEQSVATRRRLLKMGAVGAVAVVSVRPALAQTAGSALLCQINVPGPSGAGQYVAADGTLVAPGTPGSFYGGWTFTGDEVKHAMTGGNLSGVSDPAQSSAYMNYIRKLQAGQSGFTCYASLQMPR